MKILIWIQPTWRIHLWNYFGAILPALEKQKRHDVTFLVAQYHANVDHTIAIPFCDTLRRLGAGYVTTQPSSTLELFYKLSHDTMVAELARLPQYATKEKTLHMLSYPLLMACDIIESECDAVIVWEDQEPHMHFYREVARKLGVKIAKTITIKNRQIKSIKDPSKKMSKSLGDDHCIYLDDTTDDLEKKIRKAPTTPDGIKELKKIAKLIGSKFDSKQCWKSKDVLFYDLINFLQCLKK